jgi:G3E family GTPase
MTDAIPILFTVGPSRHEVVLLSPSRATLEGVKGSFKRIVAISPNCKEFMSQHKKAEENETEISKIVVRWNAQSHDPQIFPATTLVTESNLEAILRMIGMSGVGRDTLEVTFGEGGKEK